MEGFLEDLPAGAAVVVSGRLCGMFSSSPELVVVVCGEASSCVFDPYTLDFIAVPGMLLTTLETSLVLEADELLLVGTGREDWARGWSWLEAVGRRL